MSTDTFQSSTGLTVLFIYRDLTTRMPANATAIEAWLDGHYSTYLVPTIEQGSSGLYVGTTPAFLADGYTITPRLHVDGTLAGDVTLPFSVASSGGGGGDEGSGDTPVNQDTGGTDTLRIVDPGGNGIAGARLTAYLTSEWTANPATAVPRGQALTGSDGRWVSVMMLTHGLAYTIVVSDSGYEVASLGVAP
jgi:hypothetical protein